MAHYELNYPLQIIRDMWMVMINIIEKIIPVLLGGGLVGSLMTFIYDSLQTRKKRERATIALYEKKIS